VDAVFSVSLIHFTIAYDSNEAEERLYSNKVGNDLMRLEKKSLQDKGGDDLMRLKRSLYSIKVYNFFLIRKDNNVIK